ncbi:1,4-alpha-glucan branching protein GlgB [Kocuria carniphila]|uniref:1,4-alpha-glucan branching protein GlgB n=1 Tax=Kocuria carniphila TaxID=262208 RepID=UPI0021A9135E|nr:1,4-alpha-glucan branching protein GlgB [Kocuria carniphila]MCT1803432.1 1,4-alpha-glucan branching protein GlgB [Kocuria carniphila]
MTDQQVLDRLRDWLPRQRWFPFTAEAQEIKVNVAGRVQLDLDPEEPNSVVRDRIVYLVQATVGDRTELLNVPVVRTTEPLAEYERHLIGSYQGVGPNRALPEQIVAGVDASASFLRRAVQQAGSFWERRRSGESAEQASSPTDALINDAAKNSEPGAEESSRGARTSPSFDMDVDHASRFYLYDAVGDAPFLDAVLRIMDTQLGVGGVLRHGMGLHGKYTGALNTQYRISNPHQVRVISSEQSNTSVILTPPTSENASDVALRGDAVIVKFFRVVGEGRNPDVEVGVELTSQGSSAVPATAGWIDAQWRQGLVTTAGQLAVAAQFVDHAQDAWQMAVDSAKSGGDFTELARELGATTARVHADLMAAFDPITADHDARDAFLQDISGRLRWAWEACGDRFVELESALDTVMRDLEELRELPPLKRIHGDYHLGQVLYNRDNGFKILDFEGEPLRPIKERVRPDVALRDVVGMLRSLDYAGAMAGREESGDAQEWTRAASSAFLDGYREISDQSLDTESVLFQALWLDKALYEVVYEQRNRPDWVDVPANAVIRSLRAVGSRSVTDTTNDQPNSNDTFRTEEVVSTEREQDPQRTPDITNDPAPTGKQQPVPAETSQNTGRESAQSEQGKPAPVSEEVLAAVAEGRYHDPHSVLGAHPNGDGTVTVRTLRRFATDVAVRTVDGLYPLEHEWGGIFSGVVPTHEKGRIPDYRLEVTYTGQEPQVLDDPYRFAPTLGELDLHLIGEGRHETLWTALGAHVHRYPSAMGDIQGVSFAVWAPNARAVRVIGDFNGWDGSEHAMRSLGSSGIWELFIPGLGSGDTYKFRVQGRDGSWRDKADPMAFGTEVPPSTASRVFESNYEFQDSEWMAKRAQTDPHNAPMSVYELHIGSWRKGLDYVDLARELVEYLTWQGFTHVELMPVAEHPFGGSWGYQVTSYYAPSSRFGSPDEFRYLVDQLHQAGIGVLVDWVPGHFPKDEWALANFDGEPLYEHADPRRGEHKEWGTLIFDYGRSEVRNFLVANANYWLEEYHIDGLRVDAVASMLYLDYSRNDGEWEPNKYGGRENLEAIGFLQESNATAYRRNPGIVMIAEESTSFPGVTKPTEAGGLGFGIKWNMGWMHDSLEYMAEDPFNRHYHHNKATFSMVYAYSENFILPISHDEVVYGKGSLLRKMPGDRWQQLANVRAYLAYMWAHPGKQLIFMGTEYAQESEWSQEHGLDWWLSETPPHHGVQELVKNLNEIYRDTPALYVRDNDPSGFEWIDANDAGRNTLSFTRWDDQGNPLVCIANFAGNPHENFRVGMPWAGDWDEILNTDSELFGGSGVGNLGKITATEGAFNGKPAFAELTVPPLAVLYFKPATKNGNGTK